MYPLRALSAAASADTKIATDGGPAGAITTRCSGPWPRVIYLWFVCRWGAAPASERSLRWAAIGHCGAFHCITTPPIERKRDHVNKHHPASPRAAFDA